MLPLQMGIKLAKKAFMGVLRDKTDLNVVF